jgi:hypothetical protein
MLRAPERGVYIDVEDVEWGYQRLRADLLRPPFRQLAFPPHVTVVHPRTLLRGWQITPRRERGDGTSSRSRS